MDKSAGINSILNMATNVSGKGKQKQNNNKDSQKASNQVKSNNDKTTTTKTVNKPVKHNEPEATNNTKTDTTTTNNDNSNVANDVKRRKEEAKKSKLSNAYHVLPWSATLDVSTMADLTGLEKVYGLHNISSALQMLLDNSLKPLVKKSGAEGEHQFKMYRDVFLMDKKPKAIAHYKKFYMHEKQRRANNK